MTVRSRAVADNLPVDFRPASLGPLVFLEHQHAGAGRDHKTVAVSVVCPRGALRRLVVGRGHRPHRIEQNRQRPVEFLAAAGEHDVLLAHRNLFVGRADAVVRGRASRGNGIADALDLEPGRQSRRSGRAHGLGDGERSNPLRPLRAGDVRRLDDCAGRGAARPHDDSGPLVGDFVGAEAAVLDRLIHRHMIPGGAAAEKTHGPSVDNFLGDQRRGALDLGAKAQFGEFLRPG